MPLFRPLLIPSFFLFISVLCAPFTAEAAEIVRLSITIQVDAAKEGGFKWDHAPTGSPPDIFGSVVVGGQKQEISVQENTFLVTVEFRNVQLDQNDAIMFDLADRDRGRPDDVIARGSIAWNGKQTSSYHLGFSTISVKVVQNSST